MIVRNDAFAGGRGNDDCANSLSNLGQLSARCRRSPADHQKRRGCVLQPARCRRDVRRICFRQAGQIYRQPIIINELSLHINRNRDMDRSWPLRSEECERTGQQFGHILRPPGSSREPC